MRVDLQNRVQMSSALSSMVENTERESKLMQAVIDAAGACTVVLDADRTILFANRSWRHFAVRSGTSGGGRAIGGSYPDHFAVITSMSRQDRASLEVGVGRVVSGEEIEFEMRYRCTSSPEPMWVNIHAAAFIQPGTVNRRLISVGHSVNYDPISSSITGPSADGARFARFMKTGDTMLWERPVGRDQFSYIGETPDGFLGYSVDEWKTPGFWRSKVWPADQKRVLAEFDGLPKSTSQLTSEYRISAKDGRMVWIQDQVDVEYVREKEPTIYGLMTDVSDRKQAESLLADLSKRLINAQEEERKRIARELHDDLNQRMALISIELEQIAQKSFGDMVGLPSRLSNLKRQVAEISNEIHRMSYELHPSKLDHLGLAPALRSFCFDVQRTRGLRVDFRTGSLPGTLPQDVTLCLFRVAQESLQNAAKHSGAESVEVHLAYIDNTVELTVTDKGRGFKTTKEQMTKGLGLTSMRERVRHVGGEFELSSDRSTGTEIRVVIPLER